MSTIQLVVLAMVWVSIMNLIFSSMTFEREGKPSERIALAFFWPFVVVVASTLLIWRIPFKTVKAMRRDIRNRGQWKEYQEWLKENSRGET